MIRKYFTHQRIINVPTIKNNDSRDSLVMLQPPQNFIQLRIFLAICNFDITNGWGGASLYSFKIIFGSLIEAERKGLPGLPWTTKACKNFTWMRSLRQKVAGVSMCDESSRDQSLVVDHRSPAQYGGKMSSSSDGSPDLYCSVHWSNKHGLNMSSAKNRSLYSMYLSTSC